MPASRHFETDLIHTARACLLLAVRPFEEGSEWAELHPLAVDTVAVPVADVRTLAEILAGRPMTPRRVGAALAELERLSEECALELWGELEDEDGATLRPVRRRGGAVRAAVVARLDGDEEAREDALAMWQDVLRGANLDRVELELEEIIPEHLAGAPAAGRPLPASSVPGKRRGIRRTSVEAALEEAPDVERVCPGCNETRALASFFDEAGETRHGKCRVCRREYGRQWRAAHPEKVKQYQRRRPYTYERKRPERGVSLF